MEKVDYDERLYAVYREARTLPAHSMAVWCDAFERSLPPNRPLTLVDVGSGAGRFTPLLADRVGGPVYGVEPSGRMRLSAVANASHPRVEYLAGSAERIPLEDNSCDAALLYFVWHHVQDHDQAARELARVVKPGGTLLMRTQLADRMPNTWWLRAYPRAKEVDAAMYQTEDQTVRSVTASGWSYRGCCEVEYELAENRRAHLNRLRLRGISTFEHLAPGEVGEMFKALERAVENGQDSAPVIETGTLLVFDR